MFRRRFQQAISPDDNRLSEPHLAAVVMMTNNGPVVPLIKRRKEIKNSHGQIIDVHHWCDLPGGKPDPMKVNGIIRGIEDGNLAAGRETYEELGIYIHVGNKIAENDHPAKPGLKRYFYEAVHQGGLPYNKVEDEHDHIVCPDPEAAIDLLGNRIPEEVRTYIREEAARLSEQALLSLQIAS